MPRLKFSKDQPLYMETAALLRKAIKSGTLPGNSRLDSVTGLARQFHTSRKVIENAVTLLKEEGLIVSRPRQGLYVVPSESDTVLVVTSINSRAPETAAGNLLNILIESGVRKFEFIEAEFLRHTPAELFQKRSGKFSSVLLCNQGYRGNEPELEVLRALKLPVLLPFGSFEDGVNTGFHALYSDMVLGTEMLLAHLQEQGCSTVGFLGWHDSEAAPHFRLSQEKYLELIEKANLQTAPQMFGSIPKESVPGDNALDAFMENWQRFDAIICYSHLSALHLYTWCRKHQIRIPEDLKVAACGIKLHLELLDPPLTAFHVDGAKHLQEVMNFLQGKYPRASMVNLAVPPALAIHESTIIR